MTVNLPDHLRAELELGATEEGVDTLDEYVLLMYLRGKHSSERESSDELDDRLTELAEAGVASGPVIEATDEYWESLRRTATRAPSRGVVA